MNYVESCAVRLLERSGVRVVRTGWPDFLCVDKELNPNRIYAVEMKSENDKLRANQRTMHMLLEDAGIHTFTLRVEELEQIMKTGGRLGNAVATLGMGEVKEKGVTF